MGNHGKPGLVDRTKEVWSNLPTWQKWVSGLVPLTLLFVLSVNVTGALTGGDDTTKESTPSPSTNIVTAGNTLAVKIDNVRDARPSRGVQKAKVVYVEKVEGGLTRLMAVFGSKDLPDVVGPVRSARETDLEILKQYGHPAFAYSGATSSLVPHIRKADLEDFGHGVYAHPYFRGSLHPAPHNLYLRPKETRLHDASELRLPLAANTDASTKAGPQGGTPDKAVDVNYPAASYEFKWDGKKYSVYMDGNRARNTDTGPSTANTVIVQKVNYVKPVHGAKGSPYARTIGEGDAEIYRDGKRFDGEWIRETGADQTTYSVGNKIIPFDTGQTWVLLVE